MSQTLDVFVHTLRYEAEDILGIELRGIKNAPLPAFEAGAHIDLHLPNGLVRSYSLLNHPGETHRYAVAVLKDPATRGGSRCVHEQLRIGMKLKISAPSNHFPLHEEATHSVLVAGGIGVTPILSMARRLKELGRSYEVLFFARSRDKAAFVDEISALGVPVHWHFDAETGCAPDMAKLLGERSQAGTHYYACGPGKMLDNFVATCEKLGYADAHIERFAAVEVKAASDARASYTVELSRCGKIIDATGDRPLLQQLLDAGVNVDYSCEEGVCGSCETRVLEGIPDHRDSLLSPQERASNKTMMVCVSGCKSERLVLDL